MAANNPSSKRLKFCRAVETIPASSIVRTFDTGSSASASNACCTASVVQTKPEFLELPRFQNRRLLRFGEDNLFGVLFRVYPLTPDFVVQDFRPIGDAVLTFLELESQRGERYKQRENRDCRCYFSAFCFTHVIATRTLSFAAQYIGPAYSVGN